MCGRTSHRCQVVQAEGAGCDRFLVPSRSRQNRFETGPKYIRPSAQRSSTPTQHRPKPTKHLTNNGQNRPQTGPEIGPKPAKTKIFDSGRIHPIWGQIQSCRTISLGLEVTKPYKFIVFGAMEVTKPYKFTGFGVMEVTKPYKFTGFGVSWLLFVSAHSD